MSTFVDQAEIDALPAPGPEQAGVAAALPPDKPALPEPKRLSENLPADVKRMLRIRVPLIVQLARRTLPVAQVRKLSTGIIVEFERDVDLPSDLLVNNRTIGVGEVVRVGENFGLRILEIRDPATRIRSFGQ